MAPLWPSIRHRLATCLAAWHPADQSARAMMAPWRAVFSAAEWDGLIGRCILPKLAAALHELPIDPRQQPDPAPLRWALAWEETLSVGTLAALLEQAFFPRWLQVLHAWLASGTPDFGEARCALSYPPRHPVRVHLTSILRTNEFLPPPFRRRQIARWYEGWKVILSPDLRAHERVRKQFSAALDLMNAATTPGNALPPLLPQADYTAGYAAEYSAAGGGLGQQAQAGYPPATQPHHEEPTFRELVAEFAASLDVSFVPRAGRSYLGLPVWGFGAVSVALDVSRQLLLALVPAPTGDTWTPVSLEQLAAMAATKAAARR